MLSHPFSALPLSGLCYRDLHFSASLRKLLLGSFGQWEAQVEVVRRGQMFLILVFYVGLPLRHWLPSFCGSSAYGIVSFSMVSIPIGQSPAEILALTRQPWLLSSKNKTFFPVLMGGRGFLLLQTSAWLHCMVASQLFHHVTTFLYSISSA